LEIKQGYTTMQGQPIIKTSSECLGLLVYSISWARGNNWNVKQWRAVSWSRWLLRQFNSVTIHSYLLDSIGLSARWTAAGGTAHAHTSCLCHTFEVPNSIILFLQGQQLLVEVTPASVPPT